MIDFYALTSPNVQKIFLMLEETELPYKPIHVDVWKGDQFKPEFLKLNPNAKIPVIVDHEGPGGKPYTCFESGAILLYLAEKTGKFLPRDMARRFDAIQWLMIQMTGVGPMFGQFVHFKRFAPGGNDYSALPLPDRGAPALRRAGEAARRNRLSRRARITRSPISPPSPGRGSTISWARNGTIILIARAGSKRSPRGRR